MRLSLIGRTSALVLVAVAAASVGAAPKKAAPKKPAAKGAAPSTAAGKKVFETAGCVACHKIAGKGGTSGPDLSKVGAEHDAAWIAKQAKNPKAMNPKSIMPAFTGSEKDLKAVAAYLASLK